MVMVHVMVMTMMLATVKIMVLAAMMIARNSRKAEENSKMGIVCFDGCVMVSQVILNVFAISALIPKLPLHYSQKVHNGPGRSPEFC